MGSKKKNGSGGEWTSRQAEDGSFELITEESDRAPREGRVTSGDKPPKKEGGRRPWLLGGGALLAGVLLIGGAVVAFSGDGDDGQEDDFFAEAPAFQPYDGSSGSQGGAAAPTEPPRMDRPSRVQEREQVQEDDYVYRREDDFRIREVDVIGLEPDGVEIFADSRGQPMSRREAQMRAERELDAIENAEDDFEARLRRRETALNSRVFESRDGRLEVAPGIQVDERIQERLNRQRLDRDLRSAAGDFVPEEEELYDDEYYDDDEYEEEYFDDEIWHE